MITDGATEGNCWRYDKIAARMLLADGRFSTPDALALLSDVSQSSTQWSVVYGISTGEVNVVMGRNYNKIHTFRLQRTEQR